VTESAVAPVLSLPRTPSAAGFRGWVQQHPLLAYMVLAFGIAWLIMVPMALGSWGLIPFSASTPLLLFMGYGPTIAAVAVTAAIDGGAGVRRLLGRLLIWRVGPQWYAAALLLVGVVLMAAFGVYMLTGGSPALPTLSFGLLVDFAVLLVVAGLINGEEIGWRGFALPRLEARFSALVACLILGAIEGFFHLPIFFTNGPSEAGGQSGMPFHGFLLFSIALAVLFGWLYNNTRGSLLLAYLFHASVNTWSQILPLDKDGPLFWLPTFGICIAAVIVVVVFGAKRLSRKPASELPFETSGG
jgi:membrane protease YdiL (CAAX protease family)